jgi:hypothetical protein
MQVISVERWTFYAAVVVAVAAIPLSTGFGMLTQSCGFGCATNVDLGTALSGLAFILLLVSLAVGGSRDPAVRQLPARDRV